MDMSHPHLGRCTIKCTMTTYCILHIVTSCTYSYTYLYAQQTQPGSPSESGGREGTAVAVEYYAPRAIGIARRHRRQRRSRRCCCRLFEWQVVMEPALNYFLI